MRKDNHGLDGSTESCLGLLVEDAEQSYAELGNKVGLSAPATH
jgi:Lrp/AsnC family leucine-responsive transcriptional regulator